MTAFDALLDDAAIFPPGNLPLGEAVRQHLAHGLGAHADLLGPLVVSQADLPALAELTGDLPSRSLALTVTVASPDTAALALERAGRIAAVRLVALEVAVPEGMGADAVVPALDAAIGGVGREGSRSEKETSSSQRGLHRPAGETPAVYVELPRDDRRAPLLTELATTPYLAKLRTGGVRADLHPDEAELAGAIVAAVRAGVPFKATAGLHHAIRNTDPVTGFEQHGFLNVLAATDAALAGADRSQVAGWLAERDERRVTERVADLPPRTRRAFRSFGTCSIDEPVAELAALGLLELLGEVAR